MPARLFPKFTGPGACPNVEPRTYPWWVTFSDELEVPAPECIIVPQAMEQALMERDEDRDFDPYFDPFHYSDLDEFEEVGFSLAGRDLHTFPLF